MSELKAVPTQTSAPDKEVPVVFVDISGMRTPGSRVGFSEYLVRLWDARTLAFHEARTSVVGGQKRNRLGSLWLILNPVLNGAIYFVVFGFVFQTSKGIDNFIGYLLIGIFMFQMTTGAITSSADSIYTGRRLITSNQLPVAVLPLIRNLHRWLTGIPAYLAMFVIIILVPPVEHFSVLSLLFFPLLGLQALFMLGLSMIAAHLVARVHDLKNLLSVGVRGWLYASGVMFSVDRLTNAHPAFQPLVDWNPLHHVLSIARDVLLYGNAPEAKSWLVVAMFSLGAIFVGMLLIWKGEGTYDLGSD